MIVTTTPSVEAQSIVEYQGSVVGDAIIGATVVVGLDLAYKVAGQSMLMVSASDTAVVLG